MAQMEALNRGLDILVDELEDMATYIVRDITNLDVVTMRAYLKERLNQRIEEETRKMSGKIESSKGKYVIQKQQDLFKLFMSGKLLKANRICQNCNSRKLGIKVLNNALIIVNISKANKKQTKEKDNESENVKQDPEGNDIMHVLKGKSYLTPIEARKHLRKLWNLEKESLLRIFRFLNIDLKATNNSSLDESTPMDVFFWETILVPPNHFRPIHMLNGKQFDNEQTQALTNVMIAADVLKSALRDARNKNVDNQNLANVANENDSSSQSLPVTEKSKDVAKIHFAWQRLQLLSNRIYDKELDKLPDNKCQGVRQLLEKKEGLFRKHMMGKRVNFAARSVISPDPYIMSNEIGIPMVFAKKLTYPQPVTDWNLAQLQQMVINGPDIHPGAVSVQIEDGQIPVRLKPNDYKQRKQIADRLGLQSYNTGPLRKVKIVNRHLISGDILLLNRQPTLHKPSIMAHKARVLAKEKTLRLHYANCKCYNADFDGDEMNAHFPQSEMSRSEGYNIASVNFQYLVPKDGSPISGLIQDHIIAGVILTIRGQFFSKGDYQELLYGSLSFLKGPIEILPPAIIRPKLLWSGKQIISSLIHNIVPKDKPKPTFSNQSKINPKILQSRRQRKWTVGGTPLQLRDMCDSQVIVRDGELLCGLIDKVNLGPHPNGLIHICYELYGGAVSAALLTSLARLCTNFLQIHNGFTIGVLDILVEDKPNAKRTKFISQSLSVGDRTAAEALGLADYEDKQLLLDSLKNAHTSKNPVYMKQLDKAVKGQTDEINNKINEVCLPKGLVRQFPHNNLQMMIQTGAKGGDVNAIQISCLLGQIELEGRRVPLMMSGKTLPSFKPYETSPRSGGFVSGRFLTGIGIQEFFFHCMAGREGLIDTAVKTSRSGYLQRCLIKHLESLVVNYDLTVRDSEGSVIQFLYGEDGLDILKSQLLKDKTLPIIIQNNNALKASQQEFEQLQRITDVNLNNYIRTIEEWQQNNGMNTLKHKRNSGFLKYSNKLTKKKNISKSDLIAKWNNLKTSIKDKYENVCKPCPDPVISKFKPDINFGSISEKIDLMLDKYIYGTPHNLLNNSDDSASISSLEFTRTMHTRYLKSLCEPGEAVGLLAAQSIGEPSTQMTLNTFHFAGRGEMNVTLGIPRLREVLMTASDKIATPSMEIPFLTDFDGDIVQESERIRMRLNCVKLSDVMEFVDVVESIEIGEYTRFRSFEIYFYFLPKSYYKHNFYTNPSLILKHMETKFIRVLLEAINRKIKILTRLHGLFDTSSNIRSSTKRKTNENSTEDSEDAPNDADVSVQPISDEEDNSSDEENGEIEGDTTTVRNMARRRQELEYEEPDDEEIQVIDDSDIEEITNNFDDAVSESGDQIVSLDDQNIDDIDDSNAFMQPNIRLSKRKLREAELIAQKPSRIKRVQNFHPSIVEYDFDTSKEEWCRLLVKYDLTNNKLDMASIVEEEVKKSYIHRVGNIERTFLVKDNSAAKRGANFDKLIKTEGVSFQDLFVYDSIFDLNRIYSNDMHAIANTYGIEAAAKAIQIEMANVFGVYGIHIDSRHLSLVSDYMTVCGEIKGMNRQSMDGVSPLQAMTFETTTNFLKNATLIGSIDNLKSPSARIVVGRPSLVGTGIVETLCNPTLVTGTKPNQLFGGDIRKTMWKNKGTTKRKFINNSSLHSTILYKKLRLDMN